MIRIIIRVDSCGPEGSAFAPTYQTVDIESPELEKALEKPGYQWAAVVGAEVRTAVSERATQNV